MINYCRVVDGMVFEINVPMIMLNNINKFPNLDKETLASLRTNDDVCHLVKEGEELWLTKTNGRKIEKIMKKDLKTRLSLFEKLKSILGIEDETGVYDCSVIGIEYRKKKIFLKCNFNVTLDSKMVIAVITLEVKGKLKTESLQVGNYVQNNIVLNKYSIDKLDISVFNKISDLALKKKLNDFEQNAVLRAVDNFIYSNSLPVKCPLDAWTKYKIGLIKGLKLKVIPQYQISYPRELSAYHVVKDMKITKGIEYFKVCTIDNKDVWVNSAEAIISEI